MAVDPTVVVSTQISSVLSLIDKHCFSPCQTALAGMMKERCEFPEQFHRIIDQAISMGAGDLILKCVEIDPVKRLGAEVTVTHRFWTAPL